MACFWLNFDIFLRDNIYLRYETYTFFNCLIFCYVSMTSKLLIKLWIKNSFKQTFRSQTLSDYNFKKCMVVGRAWANRFCKKLSSPLTRLTIWRGLPITHYCTSTLRLQIQKTVCLVTSWLILKHRPHRLLLTDDYWLRFTFYSNPRTGTSGDLYPVLNSWE